MKLVDYLNRLTLDGTINSLYFHGVISYQWLRNRDIYNMRNILILQGVKRTDTIYILSEKFRIQERQVYYALKKMEEII